MDDDIDLSIPAFLVRTPERQRAIEKANQKYFADQAKRLAERRAESERAITEAAAEKARRAALKNERRKQREERAARRAATQAAYQRVIGLAGVPFTIGTLGKKLGLARALLLPAIRRGLKAGHIKKASRRRYRVG